MNALKVRVVLRGVCEPVQRGSLRLINLCSCICIKICWLTEHIFRFKLHTPVILLTFANRLQKLMKKGSVQVCEDETLGATSSRLRGLLPVAP